MSKKPILIAEVKVQSPFGFVSDKSWDELFDIANQSGDIISIHTDPRWGGSFDLIRKAKSLTSKPILAKGIHATDDDLKKAFEAGADYALVVGRLPDIFREKLFVEPTTLDELKLIPKDVKVVWNSRNLQTGELKKETIIDARRTFSGWLCQASNIKAHTDILYGVDAVLVGMHLETFIISSKR